MQCSDSLAVFAGPFSSSAKSMQYVIQAIPEYGSAQTVETLTFSPGNSQIFDPRVVRTSTFLTADTLRLRVAITPTGYIEDDTVLYYEVERTPDGYASNGNHYVALKGALGGATPTKEQPFVVSAAFPNPVNSGSQVTSHIQASFELEDVEWFVYDVSGKAYGSGLLHLNSARVAPLSITAPTATGMYTVVVKSRGSTSSFSFTVH